MTLSRDDNGPLYVKDTAVIGFARENCTAVGGRKIIVYLQSHWLLVADTEDNWDSLKLVGLGDDEDDA